MIKKTLLLWLNICAKCLLVSTVGKMKDSYVIGFTKSIIYRMSLFSIWLSRRKIVLLMQERVRIKGSDARCTCLQTKSLVVLLDKLLPKLLTFLNIEIIKCENFGLALLLSLPTQKNCRVYTNIPYIKLLTNYWRASFSSLELHMRYKW